MKTTIERFDSIQGFLAFIVISYCIGELTHSRAWGYLAFGIGMLLDALLSAFFNRTETKE